MDPPCPAGDRVANCRCMLDSIWDRDGVVIYPKANLIAYRGFLLHCPYMQIRLIGTHKLANANRFNISVTHFNGSYALHWSLMFLHGTLQWGMSLFVTGIGLRPVRRIQEWWRRVRAKYYESRAGAFMMGTHARLGCKSPLMILDTELMRLCVPR